MSGHTTIATATQSWRVTGRASEGVWGPVSSGGPGAARLGTEDTPPAAAASRAQVDPGAPVFPFLEWGATITATVVLSVTGVRESARN